MIFKIEYRPAKILFKPPQFRLISHSIIFRFDHHVDNHQYITEHSNWSADEQMYRKKSKLDIKLENDEVNDNFGFPETARCKGNLS